MSIVIPAYNEEECLAPTLQHTRNYFGRWQIESRAEAIVVDDHSIARTVGIAPKWDHEMPSLRLLSKASSRGKGYSVRHGMCEARGRIVLFTDAGLFSPIEESAKSVAAIEAGSEVTVGACVLDCSFVRAHQSRFREFTGFIFNRIVRVLTGLRFHSTQCSFKASLSDPLKIVLEQQRADRIGFDPEIPFLAKLPGLRVAEVSVR